MPGTAAGDVVALTNNIAASRTVTIDASRTVGTLFIGDAASPFYGFALAASGGAGLTFNNGGSPAMLVQTNSTSSADAISAPLTLADSLIVTNRGTLTVSGGISGSGKGLTKTGSGTLILSGANTYSGGTAVTGGGTLQLGATDTLPTTGVVVLGTNSFGNLNLGTYSQRLAGLMAVSTSASVTNQITVDGGQTLSISGSAGLLLGIDILANNTTKVLMSGGGALVVTNTSAYVTVGKHQASQSYSNTSTLDLSALSSVTLGSAAVPLNEIRVAYGQTCTGTLDLRGHVANVAAGTVTIGREDNSSGSIYTGGGTGSLLFDSGEFSVNNLIMAYKSGLNTGVNAKASGTLTIGGGTFTVNGGPITFGYQRDAGAPGCAIATLNLDGGTFRSHADFATGPSNCLSTINLNGGTLDMTGRAIGLASQTVTAFNAKSGTLTKSGDGALTLAGINTCAGATAVSAGLLVGNSGGALANSGVTVAPGAALGVRVLATDAQWSCKSLTLASGTTTVRFIFSGVSPSGTTPPLLVNGDLVNNGTLNVTVSGVNPAVGTYPLIAYAGSLTVGALGTVALPNGGVGTLVNNTGAKTIDLSVTSPDRDAWPGCRRRLRSPCRRPSRQRGCPGSSRAFASPLSQNCRCVPSLRIF